MTKQDLQQELKEKIKPRVKASDLKKLKKSKSDSDLPNTPKSQSLERSQSQSENPKNQITQLQQQIQFHAENEVSAKQTAANYLKSLQISQARVSELETRLKNNPQTELDQALFARHQNLKSWFSQYSKSKQLDKELAENIEVASEELITQDQTISQLRGELRKLKKTNQSLTEDLDLAQRLAHSRKTPFLSPEPYPFLRYALYSLAVAVFTLWLTNDLKNKEN